MKNTICYSLYVHPDDKSNKRFITLLYSLTTLFNTNKNLSFDVNVFIQGPESLEQIIAKAFPFVKINQLVYDFEKNDYSYTLSKWHAISELINYDKVLFLDCDTFFTKDCNYIFKKYDEFDFYGIYDKYLDQDGNNLFWNKGKPVVINSELLNYNKHVLGFNGINSGQMLFKNHTIKALKQNQNELLTNLVYFQSIIAKYIDQNLFDEDSIHLSRWINEQFAGQKIILDNGCSMGQFETIDISMSPVKADWNDATITHYISFCNFDIIPTAFIEQAEYELKKYV